MENKKLPKGWKIYNFNDLINTGSFSRKEILKASVYSKEGKYPIIDQGQKLIAGYTDNENLVYKIDKPIIIFGDHTRSFKFIDFDFAIGADGTKIIEPDYEIIDAQYFYFYLTVSDFPNDGYNRHFKFLKELSFALPENIETQRQIASKIQSKLSEIEKMHAAALRQKDAADSLQSAILREIFKFNEGDKLPKGWKWEKIGNCISNTQSGIASGEKSRSEGIMHLRMNNISRKGNLDLTEFWRIPATEQTISKYSVKAGDILFNNTNSQELVGKTCFIENDFSEPVLFSNHITRIRTNEKLIPEFLVYWINILWENEYFFNECERWVNQAALRVTEKLYPTFIPIPEDVEIQRQISTQLKQKLSEIEKMREAAAKQLEAIKSLPSAILKEVFEF